VLNAALMAIRRRRPHGRQIHSDQGTQYGSDAWRRFCRSNPELSMSRKGNCWDNAVTDSFFRSLNNELSGSTAGQRRVSVVSAELKRIADNRRSANSAPPRDENR
jgi:transposase InsO family protein